MNPKLLILTLISIPLMAQPSSEPTIIHFTAEQEAQITQALTDQVQIRQQSATNHATYDASDDGKALKALEAKPEYIKLNKDDGDLQTKFAADGTLISQVELAAVQAAKQNPSHYELVFSKDKNIPAMGLNQDKVIDSRGQ